MTLRLNTGPFVPLQPVKITPPRGETFTVTPRYGCFIPPSPPLFAATALFPLPVPRCERVVYLPTRFVTLHLDLRTPPHAYLACGTDTARWAHYTSPASVYRVSLLTVHFTDVDPSPTAGHDLPHVWVVRNTSPPLLDSLTHHPPPLFACHDLWDYLRSYPRTG